jgi:hypothetical protein
MDPFNNDDGEEDEELIGDGENPCNISHHGEEDEIERLQRRRRREVFELVSFAVSCIRLEKNDPDFTVFCKWTIFINDQLLIRLGAALVGNTHLCNGLMTGQAVDAYALVKGILGSQVFHLIRTDEMPLEMAQLCIHPMQRESFCWRMPC